MIFSDSDDGLNDNEEEEDVFNNFFNIDDGDFEVCIFFLTFILCLIIVPFGFLRKNTVHTIIICVPGLLAAWPFGVETT